MVRYGQVLQEGSYMRREISDLVSIGQLPYSQDSYEQIDEWQKAFGKITRPITDEEAVALVSLFTRKRG